jgi:hypothetical protein
MEYEFWMFQTYALFEDLKLNFIPMTMINYETKKRNRLA